MAGPESKVTNGLRIAPALDEAVLPARPGQAGEVSRILDEGLGKLRDYARAPATIHGTAQSEVIGLIEALSKQALAAGPEKRLEVVHAIEALDTRLIPVVLAQIDAFERLDVHSDKMAAMSNHADQYKAPRRRAA